MAEAIVDGRGSGNYVGVDSANRLMTTGSITSMPAITAAADPATTEIGGAGLGSASLVGAYDGADFVQPMRITGSHLMVAGSISSIPSISVTTISSNIYTSSEGGLTSGNNILLIEHIMTVGSDFNMTGFDSTGTADGKFSLMENNTLVSQYRSNASNQVIIKDFSNPIKFTSGGSVMIFVEHGELLSQGFQGAIYGYED